VTEPAEGNVILTQGPANPAVGKRVKRLVAGDEFMDMEIVEVKDDEVVCAPVDEVLGVLAVDGLMYRFDRRTGAEIDDELDWGPPTPEKPERWTGSYIQDIEETGDTDDGGTPGVGVQEREEVPSGEPPVAGSESAEGDGVDELQRTDEVSNDTVE